MNDTWFDSTLTNSKLVNSNGSSFSDTGIKPEHLLSPRQIFEVCARYYLEKAQQVQEHNKPTYWELGSYDLAKRSTQHIVFERGFLRCMDHLTGHVSLERYGKGQDDTDHFLTFAIHNLPNNIHLEYLMGYDSVFVCQEDSNEEVDFDQVASHPLLCGMEQQDLHVLLSFFRTLNKTGLDDFNVISATVDYWEQGNTQHISPARKKHPEIFNLIDQKEMTAEVASVPVKKGRPKKI